MKIVDSTSTDSTMICSSRIGASAITGRRNVNGVTINYSCNISYKNDEEIAKGLGCDTHRINHLTRCSVEGSEKDISIYFSITACTDTKLDQ